MPQFLQEMLPLRPESLDPPFLEEIDFFPGFRHQLIPVGLRILAGLVEHFFIAHLQVPELLIIGLRRLLGPLAGRLSLRKDGADLGLPGVHGPDDLAEEKFFQQEHEDKEVDDLGEKDEQVDMHGLSSHFFHHIGPERIGEYQDHGDDEAVDGDGLDHGETHEEGPRQRVPFIRLLCDGAEGPLNCPALSNSRSDGADPHADPRCNN